MSGAAVPLYAGESFLIHVVPARVVRVPCASCKGAGWGAVPNQGVWSKLAAEVWVSSGWALKVTVAKVTGLSGLVTGSPSWVRQGEAVFLSRPFCLACARSWGCAVLQDGAYLDEGSFSGDISRLAEGILRMTFEFFVTGGVSTELGDHAVRAQMRATYFWSPGLAFCVGGFLVSGGGRRKTLALGWETSARHLLGAAEGAAALALTCSFSFHQKSLLCLSHSNFSEEVGYWTLRRSVEGILKCMPGFRFVSWILSVWNWKDRSGRVRPKYT